MRILFIILVFASCTGPLGDKDTYEPVDSSEVDPQPRPDTLKLDSSINKVARVDFVNDHTIIIKP